jgi:hypothetical protein
VTSRKVALGMAGDSGAESAPGYIVFYKAGGQSNTRSVDGWKENKQAHFLHKR